MILADKIINERKKNGWSQEELADRLGVSRQSVSKWEGAQSVPDLQKIILMSELFGVSTDYLLRDDMGEPEPAAQTAEETEGVRRVSMEEANRFMDKQKEIAPKLAAGVSMCIASPVLLICLAALSERPGSGLSEGVAALIGFTVLMLLIAGAVLIFLRIAHETEEFSYLGEETIDTAYGVEGLVKSRKEAYRDRKLALISVGVVLCVLCCLPLVISAMMEADDPVIACMTGILLLMVAAAVNLFIRAGVVDGSYNQLLQTGDYTPEEKRVNKRIAPLAGIYWLTATAVYVLLGLTVNWATNWILWPVAGILFPVVCAIAKTVANRKN